MARQGTAADALSLLPLLDGEHPDMVRLAASCIVSWNATEFFGDVEAAVRSLPEGERFLKIVARDGEAIAVPAPAKLNEARPVKAIRPGAKDR